MSMHPAAYSWVWCNLNCRSGMPHNAAHFPSYSLWACTMCSVRYWGKPKRAPHKWCQSRFSICIYIYISAVHHSVYIYLSSISICNISSVMRMRIRRMWEWSEHINEKKEGKLWHQGSERLKKGRKTAKTQEQISEIGKLQRLRLRGARLQRKIRRSRQAKHFECRGSIWDTGNSRP